METAMKTLQFPTLFSSGAERVINQDIIFSLCNENEKLPDIFPIPNTF